MNSSNARRIYLDFNASTPLAPEVAAAMQQALVESFGNPSSDHWAGRPAREAVENARAQVASMLGCRPQEIVFTSGGSEANNYSLKGVFFANDKAEPHIVTSQVEHPAILNPCRFLERLGAAVAYLPVDGFGMVDPDDVRRAITPRTVLISIMHANNEVGTIQPIPDICRIAREHGILFHTDAAQSVGKIRTQVEELGIDLLSVAGHKLYGPKGVGALYIREGVRLEPLIHGAGHESGRRAGTENILLDAGLGAACALSERWVGMESVRRLRDMFWDLLQEEFRAGVVLNGHPEKRLPNTLNVSFVGKVGSEILARMETVAASTGSACHSGSVELSPVLKAMKVSTQVGMGAIRFSLGRQTTGEEIKSAVSQLSRAARALS
ncbi:MAG TPA: cysteine desulfurase family protein [Acidobacteriota bacterium]|nr:cysteine desulfurase family protein [Acidobacteriota bacterium]